MSAGPTDPRQIAAENTDPSGYQHLLGYRLAEWSEGRAVMELDIDARHLNRGKVVHGGVLASMIDNACGFAATWTPPDTPERLCVTLSLTVSFTGQASSGRLRAVGQVKGGGRKIVFCSAEIFDEAGRLVGFGEGSFRYRSGSESPSPRP